MAAAFIHPIKWKGNVSTLTGIRHLMHKVEKKQILESLQFRNHKLWTFQGFLESCKTLNNFTFLVINHLQGKNSNDEQT